MNNARAKQLSLVTVKTVSQRYEPLVPKSYARKFSYALKV
jgi:hypothetical protein